ncbi:MAG: reverse transcriptase domain-containing protein [Nanobdellota archaeon]
MNISIHNIWRCWNLFRKGKNKNRELGNFEYSLEKNLFQLHKDLNNGIYKHGPYCEFTVFDSKKREIVVSSVRDRIVHRIIYEYLVPIFDKTFIYDVWSCRKGKGLEGAIERAQFFMKKYKNSFVWRTDIKKFFDSVNQEVLLGCIERRVKNTSTFLIIREVIRSYKISTGIPIGNLTSQIFSNIYLNEFDRFVKHSLKPKAYMRYGDDFLIFENDRQFLEEIKKKATSFLNKKLYLSINTKNDILVKTKQGIHFIGVDIFPFGRKLKKRNWRKVINNLNEKNFSSYLGLVKKHSNRKKIKEINWRIYSKIEGNIV